MNRVIGTIQLVNERTVDTKKGKRKKYGITLGEPTEDGKYVWYNGWGSPKFKEGDTVIIEYEETEFGKQIKSIDLYPKDDKNNSQTKEGILAVKMPKYQTEITPLIKVGRKSVINTGNYQNETYEFSIIYPTSEITKEKADFLRKFVENQIALQIKGTWAINRIGEDVKQKIEEFVEKKLKGDENADTE